MVEALARNFSRPCSVEHGAVGCAEVGRDQQQIVSRLEGLHRCAANVGLEQVCQARHVKCVGNDEAFEAELFFEQI